MTTPLTSQNVTIRINGGPEIPCRSLEITKNFANVASTPGSVVRSISEAQLAYMLIIAYERCDVTTPDDLDAHEAAFRRMSHAEGSALIDLWKSLPKLGKAPQHMYDRMHQAQQLKNVTITPPPPAPTPAAPAPAAPTPTTAAAPIAPTPAAPAPAPARTSATVLPPVGRYAMQEIDPANGELVWKFYVVTQSRRNTNMRYMQEQSGDNKRQVPYPKLDVVCAIINANPKFHMEQYGKQIGRCGKCGRTLTDHESIERGIGPECWSRM